MTQMIETTPVHSKQQITRSDRSFVLEPKELQALIQLHRDLYQALGSVRAHLAGNGRSVASQKIRDLLFQGLPYDGLGREDPSFVTTQVLFDRERQPHLIGIDTHSSRNWEMMSGLSRSIHMSVTNTSNLVNAIIERSGRRRIVMIDNSGEEIRHKSLVRAMRRADLEVAYRTRSQAEQELDDECVYFDDPPSKRFSNRMREEGRFVIEPLPYFSSQYLLVLLSNGQREGVVEDLLRNELGVSRSLSASIPCTVPFCSTVLPRQCYERSAISKSISRQYGDEGMHDPEERVFQERIDPLRVDVSSDHRSCPLKRMTFVSYRGALLTGMAIVTVPPNGSPQKDVMMDLVVR